LSKGEDRSSISEEEVVNYADKRVQHDQIVTLEERFSDLKNRYGKDQSGFLQLEQLKKATFEIETKIFSILEIDPKDLHSLQCKGDSRIRI
jgi:hypothetical protein